MNRSKYGSYLILPFKFLLLAVLTVSALVFFVFWTLWDMLFNKMDW